jgi:hypothetical protein
MNKKAVLVCMNVQGEYFAKVTKRFMLGERK